MIEPRRGSAAVQVERLRAGRRESVRDRVATEEPMEIRLVERPRGGAPVTHQVAVTMRTPGDDFELAAGFLFTEGLVAGRKALGTLTYCTGPETQEYNVVAAELRPGVRVDAARLDRNFYTTSSCGVCGKASLEAVEVRGCEAFGRDAGGSLDPAVLRSLPAALRRRQGVFDRTGGIHAAALARPDGRIAVLREDVGRHNAVDKVIGHELLGARLPAGEGVLVVSGRASFEIVQKALAAGIPAVAAVGAPSSLAVEIARAFAMTLVGFLRDDGFNAYAGAWRVGAEPGRAEDGPGRAGDAPGRVGDAP